MLGVKACFNRISLADVKRKEQSRLEGVLYGCGISSRGRYPLSRPPSTHYAPSISSEGTLGDLPEIPAAVDARGVARYSPTPSEVWPQTNLEWESVVSAYSCRASVERGVADDLLDEGTGAVVEIEPDAVRCDLEQDAAADARAKAAQPLEVGRPVYGLEQGTGAVVEIEPDAVRCDLKQDSAADARAKAAQPLEVGSGVDDVLEEDTGADAFGGNDDGDCHGDYRDDISDNEVNDPYKDYLDMHVSRTGVPDIDTAMFDVLSVELCNIMEDAPKGADRPTVGFLAGLAMGEHIFLDKKDTFNKKINRFHLHKRLGALPKTARRYLYGNPDSDEPVDFLCECFVLSLISNLRYLGILHIVDWNASHRVVATDLSSQIASGTEMPLLILKDLSRNTSEYDPEFSTQNAVYGPRECRSIIRANYPMNKDANNFTLANWIHLTGKLKRPRRGNPWPAPTTVLTRVAFAIYFGDIPFDDNTILSLILGLFIDSTTLSNIFDACTAMNRHLESKVLWSGLAQRWKGNLGAMVGGTVHPSVIELGWVLWYKTWQSFAHRYSIRPHAGPAMANTLTAASLAALNTDSRAAVASTYAPSVASSTISKANSVQSVAPSFKSTRSSWASQLDLVSKPKSKSLVPFVASGFKSTRSSWVAQWNAASKSAGTASKRKLSDSQATDTCSAVGSIDSMTTLQSDASGGVMEDLRKRRKGSMQ